MNLLLQEDRRLVKVSVISTDPELKKTLQAYLQTESSLEYEVYTCSRVEECPSDTHIALVDEKSVNADPGKNLAKLTFEINPTPVVYLTDEIDSVAVFKAVKSLASDYLIKDRLSETVVHNTIRWVLETTQLKLKLEQQNKRYQSLFYNAVDPAFLLTPDWKIERANEAFIEGFATSFEEVDNLDFHALFKKPQSFKDQEIILEKHNNTHIDDEFFFKKLDGSGSFLGHLKLSALRDFVHENGKVESRITGFHGTLSNISYREKLRKIKIRADRVEMTYRLARTLAHEIRNPLTNINLALEQIRDDESLSEDIGLFLDMIGRSATRIDTLIAQLLTSSERKKLNRKECDLIEEIEKEIKASLDRARLSNINIKTDFKVPSIKYTCDAEKLRMAISNLLINAMESMDKEDRSITVGTYNQDGYICIYVSDNGEGMEESQLERLFDPFYTAKEDGLGLGLTATQSIIAEHEGEIEVESKLGEGSTFTISLPLKEI